MAEDKVTVEGGLDLEAITKEVKRFENLTILVGWQVSGGTDLAVIDIATFQEFGTSNIPARPALSTAMDINEKVIGDAFEQVIGEILDGTLTAIKAASRLGIFAVTLVKQRIIDSPNWAKELAQSTIDAKGSDKPLVDTAELLNSVTYTVNEGDAVIASG